MGVDATPLLHHAIALPSNFWFCVVNLTKAILGVGLMALPRACALLGLWSGISMLVLVGGLTWATVSRGMLAAYRQALHQEQAQALLPSDAELADNVTTGGETSGVVADGQERLVAVCAAHTELVAVRATHTELVAVRMTYSDLVAVTLGPRVAEVLSIFLVGCTFGYSILFMDVIGDSLLGSDNLPGILTDIVGASGVDAELAAWLLWKPLVLAVFVSTVLVPLSLKRSIGAVNWLNATGLLALAAFGASLLWLASAAALQGQANFPHWGPDLPALGPDTLTRLLSVLSIMPIVISAAACHQNILPLASMQRPFSLTTLDAIVATTMVIVISFYLLISFTSYVVFGEAISEDILKNLCVPALTPLVGPAAAALISYTVRIGYVLSLVGSSILNMFPLRESFSGIIFSDRNSKLNAKRFFSHVTLFLQLLAYVIAVFVPSMWVVLTFVGSIEGTVVCFIVPGILMIHSTLCMDPSAQHPGRVAATTSKGGSLQTRCMGVTVIVLGLAVMATRVFAPLFTTLPGGAPT